ncbi:hypothetical protein [Brevibacillus sp. IT-7CA2]|uniref:hypothetical protein n=1 Tax=Brevibacillus sp. IT-7CA2 TaxID=3026436 RepID=UPI0039E19AE9
MNIRFKRYLSILITLVLALGSLPFIRVSANQPPVIQTLMINEQSTTVVNVPVGTVNYTILGQSYSANRKANVAFSIKNMDTNETTQVYTQWLANTPNSGTFTLSKGTYEATAIATDEDGLNSEPYVVTIIVGGGRDFAAIRSDQSPILIEEDGGTKSVNVTFKNKSSSTETAEVGWKWKDDTTWKGVQSINFPGSNNGLGESTVAFTIPIDMKGLPKREIEFMVDPNASITEANENDNKLTVSVEYNLPDFYLNRLSVVDKTDSTLSFEIVAGQRELAGRKQTYTPLVTYGFSEQVDGQTSVSLGAGEEKTLPTIQMAKPGVDKITFTSRINDPSSIKEYFMIDNSMTIHLDLKEDLNLRALSISSGIAYENEQVTSVVQVDNAVGVMKEPVDVVLRLDGKEIGRESVHIPPGGDKFVTFTWTAPFTKNGKPIVHKLEAEINPKPRALTEITYDDNIARANITILPNFQGKACESGVTNTSATSGYYEYYCNCTPSGCQICVGKYSESITVNSVGPTPSTVKAGMGFEYQYKAKYYNDNPHNGTQNGFQEVEAEFDEGGKLPTVTLVPTSPERKRNETWVMPRAKIQRGQGDTEMIEYLPTLEELSVNPEEHVDGENKYYTSFYQRDGQYGFTVTGRRAGVNTITYTDIDGDTTIMKNVSPRLTVCTPESYRISGSPHDDYIIRRVNPNRPFPQNGLHGWDWDGYEDVFDSLAPWWNTHGQKSTNGKEDKEWVMELDH